MMTEHEWLESVDHTNMLAWSNPSPRKRRLYACACVRDKYWHFLTDARVTETVIQAERYADGLIDWSQLDVYRTKCLDGMMVVIRAAHPLRTEPRRFNQPVEESDSPVTYAVRNAWWTASIHINKTYNLINHPDILREIVNPFSEDIYFNSRILSIAEDAYCSQNPKIYSVLADYLDEFDYPIEMVNHLKTGKHYKGCWLIDQILGKS